MLTSVSNRKTAAVNSPVSTAQNSKPSSTDESSRLTSRASSSASADDDIETMFNQMEDDKKRFQPIQQKETEDDHKDVLAETKQRRIKIGRRVLGGLLVCVIINIICTVALIGGFAEIRALMDPSFQKTWAWPPTNANELKDQTVLITGANRGLGKALAVQFASFGSQVVLHCRTAENCADTVQDLQETHGVNPLTCVAADLTNTDALQDLAEELWEQRIVVNTLVLNAAIADAVATKLNTGVNRMFMVNYLANVVLVDQLIEHHVFRTHATNSGPRPRIVIVGSGEYIHGSNADFGATTNWPSSQAVARHGQTKFLLMVWGSFFSRVNDGIDVVTHSPGPVLTDLGRENVPMVLLPMYTLMQRALYQNPMIAARPTVSISIPSEFPKNTFIYVREKREDDLTKKTHAVNTQVWLLKNTMAALELCGYQATENFNHTGALESVNNTPDRDVPLAGNVEVSNEREEEDMSEEEQYDTRSEQEDRDVRQHVEDSQREAHAQQEHAQDDAEQHDPEQQRERTSQDFDYDDESNLLSSQFVDEEEEEIAEGDADKPMEDVKPPSPMVTTQDSIEEIVDEGTIPTHSDAVADAAVVIESDTQEVEEVAAVESEPREVEEVAVVETLDSETTVTVEPNGAVDGELKLEDKWAIATIDQTFRAFTTGPNICIDTMGAIAGGVLGVYACHGLGGNQALAYTVNNELITASNLCLDSSGALPSKVVAYDCHSSRGNQEWHLTKSGRILHGKERAKESGEKSPACLEIQEDQLQVNFCNDETNTQIWDFGMGNRDEL
eukprot:m.64717 g.64717  ORF g.64717 m.64717 type:complete len:787 (+) comp23470_c0_seq1:234-2594(+)